MSITNTPASKEAELHQSQDVFYVELPWKLPPDAPFVINELEFPIVKLQQLIIEDLEAKLAVRQAPADARLKELYDAILAEREDILSQRDRAYAETDIIRADRAKYMQRNRELESKCQDLELKNGAMAEEIARLSTELRHANQELEGVSARIENSVKSALANHGGADKSIVQSLEEKLREKTETNKRLNQENQLEKAKSRDLELLAGRQAELCELIGVALDNAETKWNNVMAHVDNVTSWAALLTNENEILKNDNLLHALMLEYEQLKTVYENDEWKTIVMCSPQHLAAANGDEKPNTDYAVCFCVSENKGCGHFVYLNEKGALTFPKDTPQSMLIPEEYHADLAKGMLDAKLKQFNEVVERSATRAKTIIYYARLLDVEWSKAPKLVEVCTQLKKYLPESDIKAISDAISRGKLLLPRTNAQLAEVNKRYGTNFPPIKEARKVGSTKKNGGKRK
ncbi:hypothetical protein [Vibrio fluvialis]|uniref:hypothetical protein n=1 Tax=Vibrio fluvialis TaxID=676 RepID=UPI001EE9B82C|nr:hypothetical protein [Vibrio fluvialis]MCG6387579.1 hypothetical protein [Vibrio fluvialis]